MPKPYDPLSVLVGRYIRIARQLAGLSSKQLAERVFIAPSYLSGIETGAEPPRLYVLRDLCKALNVHLPTDIPVRWNQRDRADVIPVQDIIIPRIRAYIHHKIGFFQHQPVDNFTMAVASVAAIPGLFLHIISDEETARTIARDTLRTFIIDQPELSFMMMATTIWYTTLEYGRETEERLTYPVLYPGSERIVDLLAETLAEFPTYIPAMLAAGVRFGVEGFFIPAIVKSMYFNAGTIEIGRRHRTIKDILARWGKEQFRRSDKSSTKQVA